MIVWWHSSDSEHPILFLVKRMCKFRLGYYSIPLYYCWRQKPYYYTLLMVWKMFCFSFLPISNNVGLKFGPVLGNSTKCSICQNLDFLAKVFEFFAWVLGRFSEVSFVSYYAYIRSFRFNKFAETLRFLLEFSSPWFFYQNVSILSLQ